MLLSSAQYSPFDTVDINSKLSIIKSGGGAILRFCSARGQHNFNLTETICVNQFDNQPDGKVSK